MFKHAALSLSLAVLSSIAGAQQQSGSPLQYPETHTVDTVTDYFGRR